MQTQTPSPILQADRIEKRFPLEHKLIGRSRSFIYAVNGVSFRLQRGKTLGLVGESGCGKSTVGRLICALDQPDRGEIRFKGASLADMDRAAAKAYHRQVQMIFQNPYTALNPRLRVGQMLEEILKVHQLSAPNHLAERVEQCLVDVGLPAENRHRYPFEFSGGQRQRLCIARALAVQPEVIVCDEPVSALDVSIQAQILKLLQTLQEQYQLAYLFISHDLSVIYHVCDEVCIMYLGKIVEQGPVDQVFRSAAHPYTRALLSAIPTPDPKARRKRIILSGEIPSPSQPPRGCPFFSRCPERLERCRQEPPPRHHLRHDHFSDCWLHHP